MVCSAALATVTPRYAVTFPSHTSKHSFFKHVSEPHTTLIGPCHYWLKILANSGSYGLVVELNPNECDNVKLRVFSGEDSTPFDSVLI